MRTLIITALFLSSGLCVRAQQAPGSTPAAPEVPCPPGCLLNPAPDFCAWTVSFTYEADKAKKEGTPAQTPPHPAYLDARPKQVTTTKTGHIVHEAMEDLRGLRSESWFVGGAQYYKTPGGTRWMRADGSIAGGSRSDPNFKPLPENGFRGLEFILPSNYAGMVPYGGGTCLVFSPGGSQKLDLRNPEKLKDLLDSPGMVGLIAADTRMPLVVHVGDATSTYHFIPPPTQVLTLPPDLTDAIQRGNQARARLEQPAPRPY
jgi:hypothetical protein